MYQHRGPTSPVGQSSTYYQCPRCLHPQELSPPSLLEEVVVPLVVPNVTMDYFYFCGSCGYPMDEVTPWCTAQAIEMPLPARIIDRTYDRVAPPLGDSAAPLIDFGGFDDNEPMPQPLDQQALTPGRYQSFSIRSGHQGSGTPDGFQRSRSASGYQGPGTPDGYQSPSTRGGYQCLNIPGGHQGHSTRGGYQGSRTPDGYRRSRNDSGYQSPSTRGEYQDPRTPGGSQLVQNPQSPEIDWHSNAHAQQQQQNQQDYPGDYRQEDGCYPIYPETYRFREYRVQDEYSQNVCPNFRYYFTEQAPPEAPPETEWREAYEIPAEELDNWTPPEWVDYRDNRPAPGNRENFGRQAPSPTGSNRTYDVGQEQSSQEQTSQDQSSQNQSSQEQSSSPECDREFDEDFYGYLP